VPNECISDTEVVEDNPNDPYYIRHSPAFRHEDLNDFIKVIDARIVPHPFSYKVVYGAPARRTPSEKCPRRYIDDEYQTS